MPKPDDERRYVFSPAPPPIYCPNCASQRLRAYRTNAREADGTWSRYTRCVDCGTRFIIVFEPPED